MNDRIMVKAYANENGIDLRTVSRRRKSPHRFYVLREMLDALETGRTVTVNDIYSFVQMRRGALNRLRLDFTWLSGEGLCKTVAGYNETVVLDYERFIGFVQNSIHDGAPTTWTALSIDDAGSRPVLDFSARGAQKTLRRIAAVPGLRKKISHALRDNFRWSLTPRIRFYGDLDPLSFFFREELPDGSDGLYGVLFLHGREDISKAKYEIHT